MHSTVCTYNTMCPGVACCPLWEFSTLLNHIHFQLETVGLSCYYVPQSDYLWATALLQSLSCGLAWYCSCWAHSGDSGHSVESTGIRVMQVGSSLWSFRTEWPSDMITKLNQDNPSTNHLGMNVLHRQRNQGDTGHRSLHKFHWGQWPHTFFYGFWKKNCLDILRSLRTVLTYLQPSLVCEWASMMFKLLLCYHRRRFEEEFNSDGSWENAFELWDTLDCLCNCQRCSLCNGTLDNGTTET